VTGLQLAYQRTLVIAVVASVCWHLLCFCSFCFFFVCFACVLVLNLIKQLLVQKMKIKRTSPKADATRRKENKQQNGKALELKPKSGTQPAKLSLCISHSFSRHLLVLFCHLPHPDAAAAPLLCFCSFSFSFYFVFLFSVVNGLSFQNLAIKIIG